MNKAVIFDMDGVIFDTERMFVEIWRQLAEKYQMTHIEEILKSCLGVSAVETRAIFTKTYGPSFAYDKFRKEAEQQFLQRITTEGIPLKAGVKALLDYLKQENYKMAVASSTITERVKKQLIQAEIAHYFQVILGGDKVAQGKPDPQIYQAACWELGVDPRETIAIEDSFNGVRSAYRAGLKTIMVPDLLQPNEEIASLLFKKCDSLWEVKAFLEQNKF